MKHWDQKTCSVVGNIIIIIIIIIITIVGLCVIDIDRICHNST